MKKLIFLLFMLAAMGTLPGTTQPHGQDDGLLPPQQWGNAAHGCKLRVISAKTSLKAGDAIDVTIEINNSGKEIVSLMEPKERPSDSFDISIKSNAVVEKTSYANEKIGVRGGGYDTQLKPGETVCKSVRLNRLFDLSRKDSYFVTVGYRMTVAGDPVSVLSPGFGIEITDDDATLARGWKAER